MSFLSPFGLLLGALALPLVGLYFLKIRRQRIRVPSTLLWQQFTKTQRLATPFERFRNNLLLWLQLLLLAALVLAFARPFLEADLKVGRTIVVVIDITASMAAADGDPTRLDTAKAKAIDAIDDLAYGDEAMLVVAGPVTEVRVPFTREISTLRAGIDALRVTGAEGSLAEGIELAASLAKSRPGVEILVLSDGGGSELGTVDIGDSNLRFVPVGSQTENAGITALDLRRSPSSDLERQLFVTVQQFGANTTDASVELYLDGKNIGVRTQPIVPNQPASMVFDLPQTTEGIVEVKLNTLGDLLDTDNHAYAVVGKAAERDVLLVGVDRLTTRVLSADPRFRLKTAPPGNVTAELLGAYDAIIFGTTVPAVAKGRNLLVLGPYAGGPASFGSEVKTPAVISWRRTHPTLRFVEWDGVLVARSKRVEDQGGLASIVESDAGPLMLAGERDGGRVVELAFQPLESDLPLRVAWPVLVLNSVGWITEKAGDTEASRIVAAGVPYVRRVADGLTGEVTVMGPDKRPRAAELADGVLRVRDTSDVGVYDIRGGVLSSTFAVNLLSPSESNIEVRPALNLAQGTVVASEAKAKGRREIWRELLIAAIGLLGLEWFVWNRRTWA